MQRLIESYKKSKNLHHAYFLVGDTDEIFLELKKFLEEIVGIKTLGSPDFWWGKYDTLNIEGARMISESQERKDFLGERKVFIIQADFITEEAQNSLLKVFEEPTSGTHFFIISPQDVLLPTLKSRMVVIQVESCKVIKLSSILNLKLAEQLVRAKEITDAIGDEDATKQDAILLLNQIEMELYKQGVEKSHRALEICENARASLYDRGAPIKMILENLILNV
jgi:DNA polymerase III delta prime subunit